MERERVLNRLWQAILDAWYRGEFEIARKREQLYSALEEADEEAFAFTFLTAVHELPA